MSTVQVHHGDSRDVLKTFADNSVDSVVCDPPYALVSIGKRFGKPGAAAAKSEGASGVYARASAGFMGQQWDVGETAFAVEFWAEVYRVLKPGAHVVAFSGTRTYHRLACAIEDAGFEIRDQAAWCYGSGFPKSHDVSKGIDKHLGHERTKVRKPAPKNPPNLVGGIGKGGDRPWVEKAREAGFHEAASQEAASQEAASWSGWGTALKPSWEPVCLAQKPLGEHAEWVTIDAHLREVEERLWSRLSASAAERLSTSSQSVSVAGFVSVQWSVADALNTPDVSCALMDTSPSEWATISSWSTVWSWRRILAATSALESTSTTETASSTTTDWRTLNSCLSRITPESITQAHSSGAWSIANASPAAALFSAIAASSRATLERSAAESAIGADAQNYLDAGAPKLSPAWEPICIARKPLDGTVAQNVLKWGVGGLNIDGCRVGGQPRAFGRQTKADGWGMSGLINPPSENGRWPANVVHDGSDEVLAAFPAAPGQQRAVTGEERSHRTKNAYGDFGSSPTGAEPRSDTGSAARFFYAVEPDDLCDLCNCPSGAKSPIVSPCNATTAEPSSPTESTLTGDTARCGVAGSPSPAPGAKSRASRGPAVSAESPLSPHHLTDSNIAPAHVSMPPPSSLVHNVRSAANLCGSCATAIAQSLAASRQGQGPGSLPLPDSISERSGQILRQHLALYVEGRESTDTILTTANLKQLLGSVFHAIAESTPKTEGKPSALNEKSRRFWYGSKAQSEDRLGSKHPTVKPVDLMQWLCRLVTPPGGVVLDPFAGSGSTGIAAMNEGFDCILIEREEKFVADINRRIAWARGEGRLTALEMARDIKPDEAAGQDLPLFSGDAA